MADLFSGAKTVDKKQIFMTKEKAMSIMLGQAACNLVTGHYTRFKIKTGGSGNSIDCDPMTPSGKWHECDDWLDKVLTADGNSKRLQAKLDPLLLRIR